ncbi:hypothetical protein F5Y14DRAFT_398546 [Nemania sp. NC0429]|nr:hypothetical protein F5Y14DRAFT_398546 [Nemania sp. NC0429]
MALHQPARQAAQRTFGPTVEESEPHRPWLAATQPVEESQTWVLFSPATDAGTTASYLTSTHASNITPGRSRFSDPGSLNTIAPSEASARRRGSNSFVDAGEEEDDAELDSLDGHLPEFRSNPDVYMVSEAAPQVTHVLPTHDGLGSFRLEQDGMGVDVQNKLYAFEQYNPRRIKRRRESVDLTPAELEENQEIDKIRRIESWRLEQSHYLLGEIQKETRRRRRSLASVSNTHHADGTARDTTPIAVGGQTEGNMDEDWHDRSRGDSSLEGRDSIWGRITRKIIQDLMGIDDKMLSILFGEALYEEGPASAPKPSSLPPPNREDRSSSNSPPDPGWQVKMLERVAKELGLLVHQLSEHPGAFTTFSRVQQMPIPYAGLPAIPESASFHVSGVTRQKEATTVPEFQPTIPAPSRPADVPPVRRPSVSTHSKLPLPTENSMAFTQDEWEQDLDIRLVFRYLRSRFLPISRSSGGLPSTSHLAAPALSTQDAAANAARVRQNHPLVSRSRNVERRKSKATAVSNPSLFRPASSCASQSTRRSTRRSSCSSSRHYWDIGGSVGTGSMIATTGPMGTWGEL